ncbi:unnamed protein product [Eruca vesicaria subsp. sativa]|uniref:Uncharacterized protein n=1 Tax=Eruca vesicaria subsp. sativa TaxID=29727 RepID=A0ABC8L6U1_ERUVS|nr:unnamed protein product [Eruca vesicaria subsp. sativa]
MNSDPYDKMGTIVRVVQGLWEKTATGEWWFSENPITENDIVVINHGDPFEGVVEMIRIRLELGVLTPVALTYRVHDMILLPPNNVATDADVETMLTATKFMTTPVLCVTSGPELVAKYQFLCRSPFRIGETSFLDAGITEEEHHAAIRNLVGGHPIVCSQPVLEMMFNEPQLLSVFRITLEIELVYAPTAEDMAQYPHLTYEDIISIEEGETMNADAQIHNANNHEEDNALVHVSPSPRPTNGSAGLPIGPSLRITAPQTPTSVLVVDEAEASYTGSSDGFNINPTNHVSPPPIPMAENVILISSTGEGGDATPALQNVNTAQESHVTNGRTGRHNGEPSLDLTLAIGINNNLGSENIINIEDTDSEADGDSGGFGSDPFF